MLNKQEYSYFNNMQNNIKSYFNVNVPIIPLDHKSFLEDGENILGSCHKFMSDNGIVMKYIITIDESYIRSCYYGRQTKYSHYSDFALMETICHEIAHIFFWEHDENHSALTQELFENYTSLVKYQNS